jgi:hypothetical protein
MLLTTAVQANTLTFEDLYPGYETGYGQLPAGYAGFDWSSDAWWETSLSTPGTGYEYGTIGHVSMYTAYESNVSMGGKTFDFLGAYITSAWNAGEDFTVEGWRNGSLVYTSSGITSYDHPYWFDFDFYNVDTVWFKPGSGGTNMGLGGSGPNLVIDNITVPEPATMCLLGLGGLAVLRRRKTV